MHISFTAFTALTLCSCSAQKQKSREVVEATLTWIHPELEESEPIAIQEKELVSMLASAFNNSSFLQGDEGIPYDCPFYDVNISFKTTEGDVVDVKVYLPRQDLFPGMWKHPQSGGLHYFDVENYEPKKIVFILSPHLPKSPVYPKEVEVIPPVEFVKGIPDFTNVNLPISGDFVPSDFE